MTAISVEELTEVQRDRKRLDELELEIEELKGEIDRLIDVGIRTDDD